MGEVEIGQAMCFLQCGNRLSEDTSTKEHVILNSIGGRKKVRGFICTNCNNKTGAEWDHELAGQLNPLGLLLGISRQRGKIPSQTFSTSSGGEVRLHSDGRRTISKPSHEIDTDGGNTHIRIHARTTRELRKLMKGMRRKYPALRNKSLDELMSTAKPSSHYSPEWTALNFEFGGNQAGRSLVKSALALAFDAGIDPSACDLALDYLLNESSEPCFGYFYDRERDIAINRPVGKPFHCVYVKGNSDTRTILGYIELYSLYRVVLCLSDSYFGKSFNNIYAIDPVEGEELDLRVDFDLSIEDIRSAYNYEIYDEGVWRSAASNLLECIVATDFNRALNRNIKGAVENALAKCGTEQGDYLTDAQLDQLIGEIIQDLTPFIEHNMARFAYRTDPRTESSA